MAKRLAFIICFEHRLFCCVWYYLNLNNYVQTLWPKALSRWSVSQTGPKEENIWFEQVFFTLFFYELNLRPRYLVQDHCTPLTKHFHSSFLLNNQKLINVIFVSFSRLIDQNVVSKSECSNQSSNISSSLHTGKSRIILL